MVRIGIAFALVASVVGLASAMDGVDTEYKSIELCQTVRRLHKDWHRHKLLANLTKKEEDPAIFQAASIAAMYSQSEYERLKVAAIEQEEADISTILANQNKVQREYHGYCRRLPDPKNPGSEDLLVLNPLSLQYQALCKDYTRVREGCRRLSPMPSNGRSGRNKQLRKLEKEMQKACSMIGKFKNGINKVFNGKH